MYWDMYCDITAVLWLAETVAGNVQLWPLPQVKGFSHW